MESGISHLAAASLPVNNGSPTIFSPVTTPPDVSNSNDNGGAGSSNAYVQSAVSVNTNVSGRALSLRQPLRKVAGASFQENIKSQSDEKKCLKEQYSGNKKKKTRGNLKSIARKLREKTLRL